MRVVLGRAIIIAGGISLVFLLPAVSDQTSELFDLDDCLSEASLAIVVAY